MATFRHVTEEEAVRHERTIDHAFGSDPGPPAYEGPDGLDDRLAERWGLFDGDELVSVGLIYDLHATLAGERTAVGGLGGFATPPEHRGNAHGEALQRELLAEFRDRGYPYAILWPMSIPYYRETGWGLVQLETKYAFPPETVRGGGWSGGGGSGATGVDSGRVERVEPGEYERLEPAYDWFRERYELALDRSPEWWRQRVLDDAWVYCWTPEGRDEPDGYVVYTIPGEQGEGTLSVDELVARTEAARRALLEFVGGHHPQVETVEWQTTQETRLLHDAADPKDVHAAVVPGAMGRVVDVPAAIESLPPSQNPPAPVTLSVADSLVPANDGAFVVDAGADGPTCERVGAAGGEAEDGGAAREVSGASGDDAPAAVELPVGLLSKFLVGTVTPSTASERGTLRAEADALRALDALFPERAVSLADFF